MSVGHHVYCLAGAMSEGRDNVLSCDNFVGHNVYNNDLPLDAWRHLGDCHILAMCLVDSNLEVGGIMVEYGYPPPPLGAF